MGRCEILLTDQYNTLLNVLRTKQEYIYIGACTDTLTLTLTLS